MRSRLWVALVVLLVVVVALVSVVRVPQGVGAFHRGSYLAPGLRLRLPFARVEPYPAGEQTLATGFEVTSREGARRRFELTLRYRWEASRLEARPLAPDSLATAIGEAARRFDGQHSAPELGPRLRAELSDLLRDLPVTVIRAELSYPEQALEALAAAAAPTGMKTVFIGLDGLDWALLDRLIAEGRCPTLARMKREGAWAELVSHQPVLSPLIWTSIATGRLPDEHGILDFVVRDPTTGKDTPITTQFRKVHTLWNVLSFLQERVHVVNWWATYPAEPINGVLVSERVFYQLFGIRPQLDDPANVYPPSELQEVLRLVTAANDIGYEEIRRYAKITREEYDAEIAAAMRAENPYDNRVNHLRQIVAVTRSVFAIARWLVEEQPADLLALYVEGTDTAGHRFAHYLPPKLPWVDEQGFDRYQDTMAGYYEACDAELGELMRLAPADTTWIVAADHGFFTGAARPRFQPDDFTVGAAMWHRMVGAFLASGPNVRPGRLTNADIYDLCRTLLWLEGAPISRALQGRELTELMRPGWVSAHPPRYVDSYDDLPKTWILPQGPSQGRRGIDEARLKELESLGYLSPGGGSAARPTPVASTPPPAAQPSQLTAKPTEKYNLGSMAQRRGDYGAAERHYLEALEMQPDFAMAMLNLATVYRLQGQHEKALLWYGRAIERNDTVVPARALVDFVRSAEAAGRLDRALPALEALRSRWGTTASYEAARGLALRLLGRTTEAVAAFRTALDRDPAEPAATEEMLSLASQGHAVNVDGVLQKHYAAIQGDLSRLNDFAVICMRNRRPEWAERSLQRVLESDPTSAGVLGNLAAALQMQGKTDEAAEMLARAVAARPDDGSLHFNYGAVLASLGREAEALQQFDAALAAGVNGPRVFAGKAKMLVRLGRIAEARTTLGEGSRRHPADRELAELLAILNQGG